MAVFFNAVWAGLALDEAPEKELGRIPKHVALVTVCDALSIALLRRGSFMCARPFCCLV